ncbi:hypothetical protein D3C74_270470 [compost metagenome]
MQPFTKYLRNGSIKIKNGGMTMKKWTYLLCGILIGAIVSTSTSVAAAQIKSLIGQKVTGELSIVVNGKELDDKGVVVNGRTNAPVRAIAEAIGGDLTLSKDTVTITTSSSTNTVISLDGKYYTKYDLINEKTKLESNLERTRESLSNEESKADDMKDKIGIEKDLWSAQIRDLGNKIKTTEEQLEKINDALKEFE